MSPLIQVIPAGTVKRLHVNQQIVKANAKGSAEERQPVFTVKVRGTTLTADQVEIAGPSRLVYSPDKPLACGAKVWIETHAELTLTTPRRG